VEVGAAARTSGVVRSGAVGITGVDARTEDGVAGTGATATGAMLACVPGVAVAATLSAIANRNVFVVPPLFDSIPRLLF
jgi:hypothetical protein